MNDQTGDQSAPDGTAASAWHAMHQRIYHLSDYDALSIELDQKLEKAGFDVELLSSDTELKELLQALPADMILVDAGYQRNAESINGIILQYKKQAVKPVVAVRLSEQPAGQQAGAAV